MTTKAAKTPRARGGMAGLASNLTERADSLARRSTEQDLVEAPTSPSVDSSRAQPDIPPAAESVPPASPAATVEAAASTHDTTTHRAPSSARPMHGPEGRLEASGERVVKWTLELAPQLVQALNVWERDETRRLGQRVFRERLVDLALDSLPSDLEQILEVVAGLPDELRTAEGEAFGTRVRASVREKLIGLRPELRVAGVKNVRIRDIYSAGVYRYLTSIGVEVPVTR